MDYVAAPLPSGRGFAVCFSGAVALDNVFFDVGAGRIARLVDPNGLGEPPLVDNLSGFNHPSKEDILFKGASVLGDTAPSHSGLWYRAQVPERCVVRSADGQGNAMVDD